MAMCASLTPYPEKKAFKTSCRAVVITTSPAAPHTAYSRVFTDINRALLEV